MTGGYNSGFLDSTELYDPSVGSWVVAGAKLPRPMSDMRAINIDDRVLIFGSSILLLIKCSRRGRICNARFIESF